MYLKHYGLREFPFSLTPDTGYFFQYGCYQKALNVLLVALRTGEGFIKVTGEVGTGKTMLCRLLLNQLGDDFVTAYIPNPFLTPTALRAALADELGIEFPRNLGQHRLLALITDKLLEHAAAGKRVALLIDEAQAVPDDSLEAIRLLTNLETEKTKLLQVVLFGQPELDQRLAQNQLRQLRQRITFFYRLEPIDRRGLEGYLSHRLHIAGYQGPRLFAASALRHLFRASRGIPRLVNILGHKALLAAYGHGATQVTRKHVAMAIRDSEDASTTRRPMRVLRWFAGVLAVFGAAATAAGMTMLWTGTT